MQFLRHTLNIGKIFLHLLNARVAQKKTTDGEEAITISPSNFHTLHWLKVGTAAGKLSLTALK